MLNLRLSLHYVGFILLIFSFTMLLPITLSVLKGTDPLPFVYSFIVTAGFGWLLWHRLRPKKNPTAIHRRDSLIIVVFTWFGVAIFGALPYIFSHAFGPFSLDAFTSAVFESASGFTTTGASVMPHVESIPYDVLFWRALTNFLGGMGIVVLTVAILPFLGVGGMELYQAESSGITTDKIQPQVTQTAKSLWLTYVAISVLCIVTLALAGMPIFDAICHGFASVATGGFSTRNASIGAYGSALYEWIIIVFMFLGACNFVLHYQAIKGKASYWQDQEFRTFLLIVLGASGAVILTNWFERGVGDWHDAIRTGIFQVTSIVTTTGFSTVNYETWPYLSQFVLIVLMIFGGCGGSTAGAMKITRMIVIIRHAFNDIHRFIHPQSVSVIKMNDQVVSESTLNGIFGFLTFYFLVALIATALLSFLNTDFQTAITSVLACLGNVGPAFGDAGPYDTYASYGPSGKIVLTLCMILGRLELITLVTLCFPEYWKK